MKGNGTHYQMDIQEMKWHHAFLNIYNRTRYLKYLIDITYMCMFLKCCNGIFKWYSMNLLSHAHFCQTPRKSHLWFHYSEVMQELFKRVKISIDLFINYGTWFQRASVIRLQEPSVPSVPLFSASPQETWRLIH
jgi:hypothetical protein